MNYYAINKIFNNNCELEGNLIESNQSFYSILSQLNENEIRIKNLKRKVDVIEESKRKKIF